MIFHLVGARPNFIKLAPLVREMDKNKISQKIIHSGQHFDKMMSEVFFKELGIRKPDFNLGIHSGSHAYQVGQTMIKLNEVLVKSRPEYLVVYGDVNATLAGTLVAVKLGIPIIHVEAGLRSFDMGMPEEINRIVADRFAHTLFTPSVDANENLLAEGISEDKIHLVGNIMIDMLQLSLNQITGDKKEFSEYGLVTLHRPSNVDDRLTLTSIIDALRDISHHIPLIFPMHPRTKINLKKWRISLNSSKIKITDPVGYFDFVSLQRHAKFVITDSGGVQEESTFMQIPCLILRENTERPITVERGTGTLLGYDYGLLETKVEEILSDQYKMGSVPELWDGNTSKRIVKILVDGLGQ